MKCISCGKKRFVETRVSLAGGIQAKAWKCKNCGEMLLEPKATQKALLLNKLRRGVKVKVGVLGKSLMMRFPRELVQLIGIKKGSEMVVSAEGSKKVVVTPS